MTLDDLKRLAEKATPGPWKLENRSPAGSPQWAADLQFVAALSPERVLAMIRVIEAANEMRGWQLLHDLPIRMQAYDAARAELEKL